MIGNFTLRSFFPKLFGRPLRGKHVRRFIVDSEYISRRQRETILFIRRGNAPRGSLDVGACITHGDAQSAERKHQDIIGHIADGGDLRRRNSHVFRQSADNAAFVGLRMRDI